MSVTREQLARMVDCTLLAPEATSGDVRALVDRARRLGARGVCVSPSLLHAVEGAADVGLRVSTVCGFPSGKHHVLVKAAEARLAVQFGALEVGVVVDVAAAVAGDSNALISEVVAVREAIPHPALLTVIVESALLRDDALATACAAAAAAGADGVAAGTGFHPAGGVSPAAVRVMRDAVGAQLGVKAIGGICAWGDALALVSAGADRLGVEAVEGVLAGAPR